MPASVTGRLASDIVDVADGIDRIMGNRELYVRMLARFRGDYRDGNRLIKAAVVTGDRVLAHRRTHTLKGSSGMIGARRLHALSCALEVAIRTSAPDEAECLAALAPEFEQVLRTIDGLLAGGILVPLPAQPLPKYLLPDQALLTRLIALLSASDGAAVDLLEESGASLKIILGETRLQRVAQAVTAFDYEGALDALRYT